MFIHLLRLGVVADIDHLHVLIGSAQEQVEQNIKTLRHILGCLIHRAGHVHQTEHHRLAGGLRAFFVVLVAQVEGVDKRDPFDLRPQLCNLFTQALLFQQLRRFRIFHHLQAALQLAQFATFACRHGRASRQRVLQRTHDADVGGHAVGGIARAVGFIFIKLTMLILFQIRQRQVFEQQVEIFIFRNLEDKFVLTFTVLAGLSLTAS